MIKPNELRIGNRFIKHSVIFEHPQHSGTVSNIEIEVIGLIKMPMHNKNKRPVLMYFENGQLKDCYLNQDILGIPLGPQSLQRMGCEVHQYDDEDGALVTLPGVFVSQPFYQKSHSLSISHAPKARKLKYVHELQNYYQALTGEELTIKETV